MEISPKVRKSIRGCLSLCMTEEEVEQFSNLTEAITYIKQAQPCWQAPYSVGVHAAWLHIAGTDADKAVCQNLVGLALEPMEALLETLTPKAAAEGLSLQVRLLAGRASEDSLRMLFQVRFALGFLLLANGKREHAIDIFSKMAATKPSWNPYTGHLVDGPGFIRQTKDISWAIWLTATLMQTVYEEDGDYKEALDLITGAWAFNPELSEIFTTKVPVLLDYWAAECEREDATTAYDFPTLEWLDLFAEAAELLSVCQEADTAGALPSDCKHESAQFLAWKFGQIAGKVVAPDNRWHEDPFHNFRQFLFLTTTRDEESNLQRGYEKTDQALRAVLSLLSEYELHRDWQKARQRYVSMWARSLTYQGMPLSEVGPETDLYWAMRIGFADKVLELTKQLVPVGLPPNMPETAATRMPLSIEKLVYMLDQKVIPTLGRIEQQQPGPQKVVALLEQQMGGIWEKLPPDVADALVDAEQGYLEGTRTLGATWSFHRAVELFFRCYFVNPLVHYMREEHPGDITLLMSMRGEARPICIGVTPPWKPRVTNPSRLSLAQWACLFETLADPLSKGCHNLPIKAFMKQKWPKLDMTDLKGLVQTFKEIQKYRNADIHPPLSRLYGEAKNDLEQMHNLVLGIDQSSVIQQIFDLLGPKQPG